MADPKKKEKVFDPRIEFLASYCLKTMRLKLEKWVKMLSYEENMDLIMEFLVNPLSERLIISVSPAGVVLPMSNFPASAKGKNSYFVRKKLPTVLTVDNMNKEVMYGDVSPRPIDDLSILVDFLYFPILMNGSNQEGWPEVMIKDVVSQIQILRNTIAEVRGNINNQTILPMPMTIDRVMNTSVGIAAGRLDMCDGEMKNSLESIVLKWSDQIEAVLKEDVSVLFKNNPNPLPFELFSFWTARLKNLENIFDQLRDPQARTIGLVLEKIDSVYYSAFRTTFNNVVHALHVARDLTLYFIPLQKQVEQFDSSDFDDTKDLVRPLLHVICLVWAHSQYCCTNNNMVILFALINNMLIANATKTLDPGSLFQGEADEGLLKLNATIDIFLFYKEQFFVYEKELPNYIVPDTNPILWSFKPKTIFKRLDAFVARLEEIKKIFITANEFIKLEKVEIGGLRGRSITRSLAEIYENFQTLYRNWTNIVFDPLDPDPNLNDFEDEKKKFENNADNLERMLAYQINLAFDDCYQVDQVSKLIEMLGSLMHRPIIFEECGNRFQDVVELFAQELDRAKFELDEGIENMEKSGLIGLPIPVGMPAVCGALTWVLQLKEKLTRSCAEFVYLDYPVFESEEGVYQMERCDIMMDLLVKFETAIFDEWNNRLPDLINENMVKKLLIRGEDGLLKMNFDDELKTALKNIKYIKLMNFEPINEVGLAFYEREEELWDATIKLERVVEWYNYIHVKTARTEHDLVENEVQGIDFALEDAISTIDWNDFDRDYVVDIYNQTENLYRRIVQSQDNIKAICESFRKWGNVPLFIRKDNNNQALLNIDDRDKTLANRIEECNVTKALIDEVMDENFRLFHRLPLKHKKKGQSEENEGDENENEEGEEEEEMENERKNDEKPLAKSQQVNMEIEVDDEENEEEEEEVPELVKTESQIKLYRQYEEYIDEIVATELMQAISNSMRYIMMEMENRTEHDAAVFEVKMELQIPHVVYIPDLKDTHTGLLALMEEIIFLIYYMSELFPRVAQPLQEEKNEEGEVIKATYESILSRESRIDSLKRDIINNIKNTCRSALEYLKIYRQFSYLWTVDRNEYLRQFLKYGRPLTPDELEILQTEGTLPLKDIYPSLKSFQEQIDSYATLYENVSNIESSHVFRVWLRVDMKAFKYGILNEISRWSSLFKQYLVNHVIDSLQDLEDFCGKATEILSIEVQKEDLDTLLKILSILNEVEERKDYTDDMFEPLKDTVTLLKEYNVEMPDKTMQQFADLPGTWNLVKKLALNAKQTIGPIQAYQVDLIDKQIKLFAFRLKLYRDKFETLPIFNMPGDNIYLALDKVSRELFNIEDEYKALKDSASLFELQPPDIGKLTKTRLQLKLLKQLWDLVFVIDSCINDWKKTPWKKIDVEVMDQECKKFGRELRSLDKDTRTWDPYLYSEAMLKNLMTSLRAVTELQNPAIRDRHWQELMQATQVRFKMDDSTTLADLLALQLHKYEDDVKNIVDKSVKEMGMEKILKDLSATWKTMEFEYEQHNRTNLKVLKVSEELVEILEENQVQLQNLLSSKFIGFFLEEVSDWQTKLSNADQVINMWFEVQRKWMYLESIFIGSEDIRNQLPEDSKRFDQIDRDFKGLLQGMTSEPNVIKATNKPGLYDKLETLFDLLVLCEKALNDYLETKRLAFPRFYFVSSADLLDILSNGNQPDLVARHLTKLYDSLAKLTIEPGKKSAGGMISKENEELVQFKKPCDCSGKVEVWLNRVTDTMRITLHNIFDAANRAYENKPRDQWILDWPAQPALCTTQIWWSFEVNIAFAKLEEGYENALKDYQKKQIALLNALIVLLLGDLSQGDRQKIMTICTIDVHSRDVVAKMILQKVESATAFQWQSQLRHRWDVKIKDCFANICDAQFRYDYEYLGNTPRLVITPLTDRCYITLTQSLHLIMGGAPAGPAGTGKTETTKDLGRALGIMVYVFNCSEQMDYKSCGNIYKGLAQTGAWGCFDEFNRISVEVLSVVAVQVKTIQDAIKAKKINFNFMGEPIVLVPTVGMFITMNPGYAGRTELPENLKALFRPCAMVVPDFALISEIMLVAEGFQEARLLARKFITLYTLCKELLSKQDHYDWGLRAIKSVLVVAGSLKRDDRLRPEDQVLMRALRDFNIPKIVTDDVPIFMGLIGDLFPALDIPRKRILAFEELIKVSSVDLHLQPEEGFVLKVVQLEELFAVRHSVFIIGYAGTGKTQVWKTLNRTYYNQKRKPFYNDLNPKAVTNDELFGIINPATREWKDGLFSVIMRDQANMSGNGPKWIVLDGDIDPMWIESLNTLMDDNKVLTLASNERIALTKEMRLLFEISNLRTATPATVSRAGILYINPQDLGWNPFVASWIDTRESISEKASLNVLFDKYIPPLLEASKTKFKKITPISEIAMIQMTCHLLDCLLTPENVPLDCPKDWYEIYFVFAILWGFGSTIFQDQLVDWRNEFNKWWLNEFKAVRFPSNQGTIFNFFIDPETKKFLPWTELVTSYELDTDIPLQSTLVSTAETTRLRYFMDILIEKHHPVMLIGGAGSGKSVIVAEKLNSLPEKYAITNVPFNFYTTSDMLQKILEKPLEKKAGRNFGPPGGKTMIYFVDDMNMPEVDTYGTVQPHTLIRQFMDYEHWYDRTKLSLKDIHHCQFIACMNPTAGSFTINPRLQRHYCAFAVSFPGPEALYHIYYSILSQHVANPINKFSSGVINVVDPLIKTAITLHQKIGSSFLPTAVKFHYSFNMRDLANIFQGMLFGNGETAPNSNAFIRSWMHEVYRVYGDKLVDTEDIVNFTKLVNDNVKKGFEELDESKVFVYPLIYCHFAESLVDPKYLPVKDWATLSRLLAEAQANYNEMIGAMNLVLFDDAMAHICRISRIIEAPRGYALLIGVGGSGKQSLTRLAAFISNLDVSQVQLRKGYSITDLKADLALLYMKTGVKNVASCYLMTDSQVAEEIFLVLVNDMLASGEIPELFPDDEIDNIISNMRNEVKQMGIVDTKENCWKYFIEKVRRMLKVVLCFSPVGSILRIRARKFPAIVNCTSIDWFHEWPKNALESVSERFLQEIEELPKELSDPISRYMAYVHETVNSMSHVYLQNEKRYNYTTPKSFLELIALYSKLLREKNTDLKDRIVRLENGLLKLVECSAQVDGLRDILKDQEVILKVKNDAADKLIVVVSAENEKVQKEKNYANEEEKKVRIIEEDVGAKAKLCEEDLRKAEPALVAAQAALNTLNKNNLTELKSFGSPPEAAVNVCAAVMVLFSPKGKIPKDRSWKACKVMMGKVDQFLNDLVNYDKEHIHPDVIKALLPYLHDPEFDPITIASKSGAAAGLCSWVINIHKFYEVFLIVEPKQRALKNAQTELKNAQDKLEFLNNKIQELEQKLSVIQAEFDAAMGEKAKCQAEADKTAFTIDLAHRLVNGLASENVRWHENVISFEKQCITLPGDVLLVSCFISYVGCFTRSYRLDLLQKMWIPTFQQMKPAIPVSAGKDPLEMLCDDAQIAVWNNEGLPSDRMSAENATILTNSSRWPLMIDPQLQGIKWIKEKYGDTLVVLRLTMRGYLDVVEKSVSDGRVLLIESIGEAVDAVLDPLLGRALIKKGKCLKMGDAEIDYNPNFRLILQTKLANPHYKPEMQAQTTLINFTVTRDGLEEQLLAEVVKAERPDLEELKKNLTMQQNNFKITLKILEDDLLQRLSSAGKNVLEDPTLVLNLEKTKKTAAEVEVKVKEAKITSVQIDEAREHYRTSAERASILYFILNDLCKINKIYQFSLKAFTTVFKDAIYRTPEADTLSERVINLIDSITFSVFMYTSRGLFECDKLIFMAQTAIQILLYAKEIKHDELDFLLRFPYTPNLLSPFDFLTHNGWGGIKALSSMEEFRHLDKDIEGSSKRWKKFAESECPEKEKFPGEWKNKNALQRLCIMRALRPDRMTYAVSAFVEEKLGKKYVEARTVEFAKSFEETSATTPVFFILSPGVDPLKDVEKLGKKLKFSTERGNFYNVSLGQGQEIVAENAIDVASKLGHWVILQNIHLVAKWLPTLEKKMEATLEGSHEDYRLFVSAEPAASAEYHIIPQGILESAIKITNEPPTGMCANVHKALDNFNQETLEMCAKEAEFKAVLFSLCYFHAVVAERRKFGPQGWNRSYPFNVGDLTISVYVLYNYLEANSKVPWEDLRYLFGEIMYGGHITDDWDRRLCRTYLEEFMQPELVDGDLYLANGFLAPPNSDYSGYHKYIDDYMPAESPTLYGLHTNAEIGFLTTLSETTFKTIFELQPRDSGASTGASVSREETCKSMVEDIIDKLPEEFNMIEIMARVEERTPFIIVAFQECERMNTLVSELKRSLKELHLGLKGELTITQDMEKLEDELFFDIVPESWTKRAYPSLLNLQSWFADLLIRLKELEQWAADFNLPSCVWLAGFFNPQSFLTAIMQQTARKNEWPLDKMCLNCDVTKKQKEDFSSPPREGAYVNGLYMEGARWDMKIGSIGESLLKELFPPMPVIYIKAVTQDKQDVKNIYECPVYKIRMRGPTFVWTFNLKTKERASKWTLAGVCLLLQV